MHPAGGSCRLHAVMTDELDPSGTLPPLSRAQVVDLPTGEVTVVPTAMSPATTPAVTSAPPLTPEPMSPVSPPAGPTARDVAPQVLAPTTWRRMRWAAVIVVGIQLAVLLLVSGFAYRRFNLGIDFATYSQAWSQIGLGDLNPFSTIVGTTFLHINFELLLWPVSLLYLLVRQPTLLLIVQDLALAGTGLVCLVWCSELLERKAVGRGPALALMVGAMALWVANPASYAVANQDFHFEAVAAMFAVLAARDLWGGRSARSWWWVAGCLLCGENGGLYVVGLGISCLLAGRPSRRRGLLLIGAGVVWLVLIAALGANKGPGEGYAWLARRRVLPAGVAGPLLVVGGLLSDPGRAWHVVVGDRLSLLYGWLRPSGVIGIVSPWGLGVPLVALVASSLQQSDIFLELAFQNYVVYAFLLFGTVSVLVWMLSPPSHRPSPLHRLEHSWARRPHTALRSAVAGALWVAVLVGAFFYTSEELPLTYETHGIQGVVAAAPAAALGQALEETPASAEVVAPTVIVGRFGERRYIYQYLVPGEAMPVSAPDVVVVLSWSYGVPVPPADAWAAGRQLRHDGWRTLVDRAGIWALEGHPPPGTRSLTLP